MEEHTKLSKEQLESSTEKKFKTVYIGAIAAAEEIFGDLWNHKSKSRNIEEQEIYQKYQEFRSRVLKLGNDKFRAFTDDLKQYEVDWKGYQIKFEVKNGRN